MKRLVFCAGLIVVCMASSVMAQEKAEKKEDPKFKDQKMIQFHVTRVVVKDFGESRKEHRVWGETKTSQFEIHCLSIGGSKSSHCGDLRVGEDIKALRGIYSDTSSPPTGMIMFVPHNGQSPALYYIDEEAEKPKPASGLIPGDNFYATAKPVGEQRQPCSGITPLNIILFLLWILTLLWGAIWRTPKRRAPLPPSQGDQPTATNP